MPDYRVIFADGRVVNCEAPNQGAARARAQDRRMVEFRRSMQEAAGLQLRIVEIENITAGRTRHEEQE